MNAKSLLLLKRPVEVLVGVTEESAFSPGSVTVPDGLKPDGLKPDGLKIDELRLHGLYNSVNPYIRGRMNADDSSFAPFELNRPIAGYVVDPLRRHK